MIQCSARLELQAIPGLPIIQPGDELPMMIKQAIERAGISLQSGDVLVVASKAVSRAEGRFVDLQTIEPSPRAEDLAHTIGKDARMVELILRESHSISRTARDVLVVRHRLGFISANASIDCSNVAPPAAKDGSGPWALILPESPDASAERIRGAVGAGVGVVISDSLGRPFRLGTVGAAVGVAGLPALWDRRGESDLFGRKLEHTITALADQVAAAGDLVAGQAGEGRAVVHVRGLSFEAGAHSASELLRPMNEDLYA
jgi:coenzyme F420-0:L-glutamate ligase/coenzyme F420-1:gamma-L-glutamate ligase